MRKTFLVIFLIGFLAWGGTALALPSLQLDVSSGFYNNSGSDYDVETVVANTNPFTLYALLDPTKISPSGSFYISIAVWPAFTDVAGANLGSFVFDGNTFQVTSDMELGTPPIADVDKDLQSHGVFETYFSEIAFEFDPSHRVGRYNVAPNTDGDLVETASFDQQIGDADSDDNLYYAAFEVNAANLSPEYSLHFDLYNIIETKKNNGCIVTEIGDFAPFSHDAQSGYGEDGGGGGGDPTPEPGTMLLVGMGILGLAVTGRKKFIK